MGRGSKQNKSLGAATAGGMEWENIGIDPVARRLRQVDMRDTSDLDMGDTVSCAPPAAACLFGLLSPQRAPLTPTPRLRSRIVAVGAGSFC